MIPANVASPNSQAPKAPVELKDYWLGLAAIDLKTQMDLDNYWKGFHAAVEQLSQIEGGDKLSSADEKELQRLQKYAFELAELGASMNSMDDHFRPKYGKLCLIENEHFNPGQSFKITSRATFLFGEVYYRHLCLFQCAQNSDHFIGYWLQKEKQTRSASNSAKNLKKMLEEYRENNKMAKFNYDATFPNRVSLSPLVPALKGENIEEGILIDGNIPEIEKELNAYFIGLQWPTAFLETLNQICKKNFNLDVNQFQLAKRMGNRNNYIPNLTVEATKTIDELHAIHRRLVEKRELIQQLKDKMFNLREQLNKDYEQLLKVKNDRLEKRYELEQQRNLAKLKLDNSKHLSNQRSQPNSPGITTSASQNNTLWNMLEGLDSLTTSKTSVLNHTKDATRTPLSPSEEAQRSFQQTMADIRAQESPLSISNINESLKLWEESARKKVRELVEKEQQLECHIELKALFEKLNDDLKDNIKVLSEETEGLSHDLKLVDSITQLYWQAANHEQLVRLLQQNPRDNKTNCNRYLAVLMDLQAELGQASLIFKQKFPEDAKCFAKYGKQIQDEFEITLKLLLEYYLLTENSPPKTQYRSPFNFEQETLCFVWNLTPSRDNKLLRWPVLLFDVMKPLEGIILRYRRGEMNLTDFVKAIQKEQAATLIKQPLTQQVITPHSLGMEQVKKTDGEGLSIMVSNTPTPPIRTLTMAPSSINSSPLLTVISNSPNLNGISNDNEALVLVSPVPSPNSKPEPQVIFSINASQSKTPYVSAQSATLETTQSAKEAPKSSGNNSIFSSITGFFNFSPTRR